jgi:intracellular multiplication protein IcmP
VHGRDSSAACLNRHNPRVEAIGARAHWDAERRAKCPLFEPEVESALRAVRAAILQHREEQKEQP